MKIYIVVLHYGNIDDTKECLSSIITLNRTIPMRNEIANGLTIRTLHLLKNFRKLSYDRYKHSIKIILINNDIRTNLKDLRVKFQIDDDEYIANNKNLGYSAAINLGIKKSLIDKECDFILILNNDLILPSNFLNILTEKNWEIIGPVIKFKWNKDWVYDYGGKINWWTGRTWHIEKYSTPSRSHFVTPGRWPKGLLPGEIEKIDYVSGCCMLVKRQVFEKIGLFDTDYFFYFEDVDFCLRAKKAGFQIKVSDQAAVFHKLSSSIGRWSAKAIKYNLAGNFIFINKYLGARKIVGFSYLAILVVKIIWDKLWNRQKQ